MEANKFKFKYRADLDGLRAVCVLAVIFFHAGFTFLAGGYVGVDVFFVISGYLITSIVHKDLKANKFSFKQFYKKRGARLLPALLITLMVTGLFGFIFYDNKSLDNLGREIMYGAFGAANILFAQGENYFVTDESYRPLIHLWTLGIEEQFYFVWPILLVLLSALRVKQILAIALILCTASLVISVAAVETNPIAAYFYTHYRAYELLIGAVVALSMIGFRGKLELSQRKKEILSLLGILLIIVPMFLFDESTTFPGLNALYPCIGTALLICWGDNTLIAKGLSLKPLVWIGLISYPLYLYHQPLISYCHFFGFESHKILLLLVITTISIPLAWATYRYIEQPIRKLAHKPQNKTLNRFLSGSMTGLVGLALIGLLFAKSDGLEQRFTLLNPFALEISDSMSPSFYQFFEQGYRVAPGDSGKILFIGDSVLQQYVLPVSQGLGIEPSEVDTVTRGGCVLLKDVKLVDRYQAASGISCDRLRQQLYQNQKRYDYIFISQSWISYGTDLLNASANPLGSDYTLARWQNFIDETVKHFQPLANRVVVLGGHPIVEGTDKLQPTLLSTPESYRLKLENLEVVNQNHLQAAQEFFAQWQGKNNLAVISPQNIWNGSDSKLHDGKWSFFDNGLHISQASNQYVVERLQQMPAFFQLTQADFERDRLGNLPNQSIAATR
ncbi:MAG: acyltransferase family protein [Cyanobacteria bacterium J06648_1]